MSILIAWCLYLPFLAIYRYSRLELFHPEQKEDNNWTKCKLKRYFRHSKLRNGAVRCFTVSHLNVSIKVGIQRRELNSKCSFLYQIHRLTIVIDLTIEHTTPSIPYRIMATETSVWSFKFLTGRTSCILKTGERAFSRPEGVGLGQFGGAQHWTGNKIKNSNNSNNE